MPAKRPMILMGVLLLAVLGYFLQRHLAEVAAKNLQPAPVTGTNSLSNLRVHQDPMGTWVADFDYFFTGEPRTAGLVLKLDADRPEGTHAGPATTPNETVIWDLRRGRHHVSRPISHPGLQQTTNAVSLRFYDRLRGTDFATQKVEQVIEWPDYRLYTELMTLAKNTPEQNLRSAQDFIGTERYEQIAFAKTILEKLLQQNPRFDPAYVELARVALKTNGGGRDGNHQAETLLSSALQINPGNVNAQILLGYVYTHQNRFAEAEAIFTQAAAANPPNAFLWENWGELRELQHKPELAVAKYREAISRPNTHDTYDRGRRAAYRKLLSILGQKKDLDGMETVFKQQIADYGPGSCYSTDYARFLLQIRGDTQGAIDLARRALNKDCDDAPSREVLGLAEYLKWAETKGPDRADSLNQARIYMPAGPKSLYLLAASDRTTPAVKQLIATGEHIDQKSDDGETALMYALEGGDLAAARRLLQLHARPDISVGPNSIPLALVPVMRGDLPAIHLMREFGVNYSTLRYQGVTAVEFAKQSHNPELLEALGNAGTTL